MVYNDSDYNILSGENMVIQDMLSNNLNIYGKQKIKLNSIKNKSLINRNSVSFGNNKDSNNEQKPQADLIQKQFKKVYWKGVFAGVLWTLLVIGGDYLCEYLIRKNSPKFETPEKVRLPFKWVFK